MKKYINLGDAEKKFWQSEGKLYLMIYWNVLTYNNTEAEFQKR